MENLNFGVYHHSTAEESEKLRNLSKIMFMEAFQKISIDYEGDIKIIDIGSGLGFMTIFIALKFPNASITSVDLFSDASLKNNSKNKLQENLRMAGIESRVRIIEADITKEIPIKEKFDLAVSNLVLHNTGRYRFAAYKNIRSILKNGSYFLNADGFIRRSAYSLIVDPFKRDMARISDMFDPAFAIGPKDQKRSAIWRYILVGLKAKGDY
ncbi:MAG: SAM-dependent methyltransferase [Thermoplasmata archaeon]